MGQTHKFHIKSVTRWPIVGIGSLYETTRYFNIYTYVLTSLLNTEAWHPPKTVVQTTAHVVYVEDNVPLTLV